MGSGPRPGWGGWQIRGGGLLLAAVASAAEPALPARVARWQAQAAAVRAGRAAPGSLARQLPAGELRVDGAPVDLRWLHAAAARSDAASQVLVDERLRAWAEALQPGPAHDNTQIAAVTREILAAEAFQPIRAASWIDPWIPTIERVLDWLLAPFTRRGGPAGEGSGLLASGLYLAVSVALLWALRRVVRPRQRGPVRPPPPLVVGARAPSAATWRQRRVELAAVDPAAALAALWRALTLRLAETGRLACQAHQTPREVLAAAPPELAAALRSWVSSAEQVWYGGRPPRQEDLAAGDELLARYWNP
ncbi:MAG: DUF4129 domain-containing protein [Fimbriimonadaceae bacterium]|nr:DUF4129 domain-containing protein [Fimbriimonadaceae bacterium]